MNKKVSIRNKRIKQKSHLQIIREAISDKASELSPGDKDLRRLFHLWITIELKIYFGLRFFDEIPTELTPLILQLISSYRDEWYTHYDIASLIKKNSLLDDQYNK